MNTDTYGVVGSNKQYVGRCPLGGVLMSDPRPSTDHIAQADGTWVLDLGTLAAKIRAERNKILAATDWHMLADVTADPVWMSYRQALRDLTEQTGFPIEVTWPEAPAG